MAASLTESVELPVMTPMQRLALANDRLAELKAEAKRWQAEYDESLDAVLSASPKFERSKFLRATGGKANGYMYKGNSHELQTAAGWSPEGSVPGRQTAIQRTIALFNSIP